MPDILTDKLYFLASVAVSSIDGVQAKTVPNAIAASAFLGTMAEFIHTMLNRIDSPSTTLISGGSAGAVALGLPSTIGNSSIRGRVHGMPFTLTNVGVSGQPASGISTTSGQIRKVGVALKLSALAPGSSFDAAGGALQFVIGSAFATSAGAVTSAAQTAYFNSVPTPKFSADQIPVGLLLITNSFAPSAGIVNSMVETDARQWAGAQLSLIMPGVVQP